jgi:hypothetical protein
VLADPRWIASPAGTTLPRAARAALPSRIAGPDAPRSGLTPLARAVPRPAGTAEHQPPHHGISIRPRLSGALVHGGRSPRPPRRPGGGWVGERRWSDAARRGQCAAWEPTVIWQLAGATTPLVTVTGPDAGASRNGAARIVTPGPGLKAVWTFRRATSGCHRRTNAAHAASARSCRSLDRRARRSQAVAPPTPRRRGDAGVRRHGPPAAPPRLPPFQPSIRSRTPASTAWPPAGGPAVDPGTPEAALSRHR